MPLKTTCIGAFPKPDYVPITDWFQWVMMPPIITNVRRVDGRRDRRPRRVRCLIARQPRWLPTRSPVA